MLGDIIKDKTAPVAVFDSGVGGISVLKALVQKMPNENYIYFGDSLHAPYGTKPLEEIRRLTMRHVDHLVGMGAKAVVVACNTATSAAITILRENYTKIPIIGIEPALKPAVISGEFPRVVVMATPLTLREEKFLRLMKRYESQAQIVQLPCPGLVEFIESGDLSSNRLEEFLRGLFGPVLERPVDAVVLGCTHYPFVEEMLQKVLGKEVMLYEGGPGTARETYRRLKEEGILNPYGEKGEIIYKSSEKSRQKLELCRFLMQRELPVN